MPKGKLPCLGNQVSYAVMTSRLFESSNNLLHSLINSIFIVSGYVLGCLAMISMLLLLSRNVEVNPGPNYKFPYSRCDNPVKLNQDGLQCYGCNLWFHRMCESLSKSTYLALSSSNEDWLC